MLNNEWLNDRDCIYTLLVNGYNITHGVMEPVVQNSYSSIYAQKNSFTCQVINASYLSVLNKCEFLKKLGNHYKHYQSVISPLVMHAYFLWTIIGPWNHQCYDLTWEVVQKTPAIDCKIFWQWNVSSCSVYFNRMTNSEANNLAGPYCAVCGAVLVYSVHVFAGELWERGGGGQ